MKKLSRWFSSFLHLKLKILGSRPIEHLNSLLNFGLICIQMIDSHIPIFFTTFLYLSGIEKAFLSYNKLSINRKAAQPSLGIVLNNRSHNRRIKYYTG
jgi:hypothetical protein